MCEVTNMMLLWFRKGYYIIYVRARTRVNTARHKTFFGMPTLVTRIPISMLYNEFSMLSFIILYAHQMRLRGFCIGLLRERMCNSIAGLLFHVTWNNVTVELEQHSSWHGTGLHHSDNVALGMKACCKGLFRALRPMMFSLVVTLYRLLIPFRLLSVYRIVDTSFFFSSNVLSPKKSAQYGFSLSKMSFCSFVKLCG